jgi:Zn-finger nucleic acid-binding protein
MNLCCVKCTSVLDKAKIEDIELDLCPQCGGLWLDNGEIERLTKKADKEVSSLREMLATIAGAQSAPSDAKAACPACPGQLKEVPLGPILIDFCTRCRGLFLDRGELDTAIATIKDKKATVASLVTAAAAAVKSA